MDASRECREAVSLRGSRSPVPKRLDVGHDQLSLGGQHDLLPVQKAPDLGDPPVGQHEIAQRSA